MNESIRRDASGEPFTSTSGAIDGSIASHVLESLADGIVVVDTDGQIVFANPAAHAIVGTAPGGLIGKQVDDLVPRSTQANHSDLRKQFIVAQTPRPMGSGLELTMQRMDGTELPVEISLSPFATENGLFVIAALRDVTDRRDSRNRLASAQQQLTLIDERERIGRDLHDVVLQRLYGTGLTVQAMASGAEGVMEAELEQVVDEIDRVIADIRTIVFTLGSSRGSGPLGQELSLVVAQSMRLLGFPPSLQLDGPVESVLTDEARVEMIASMREALGNVARHANASKAEVSIVVHNGSVVMTVTDDGVGPPTDSARLLAGNGLVNLQARAATFGGHCELIAAPERGARLIWSIPF